MTATPPTLRVTMVWAPTTDTAALDVTVEWADRLAGPGRSAPPVCIWTARATPVPTDHPAATRACWHDLDLPSRIDRHAHHRSADLAWSPWGTKSGPNFQFFALLDAVAAAHPEEWILFAEPDTVPVGPDPGDHLAAVVTAHPDAWVIGAHPHPGVLPDLPPGLHHHLNGAALYRVADPAFAEFRAEVWVPSLLWQVRRDPEYAYDCITDPSQWAGLPPGLATAWADHADRFVPTAGMVNASTLTVGPDRVTAILTEPALMAALDREPTRPWLLHAKGPILDAARAPAPPTFEHVWGDLLDPLAVAARAADRVVVFLHSPKTGGTTLTGALVDSPRWVTARLHDTRTERDTCSCGVRAPAECVLQRERRHVVTLDPDACRGRSLAVVVGHESYAAVCWVTDRLVDRDVAVDLAITTVRPTRARLVSAFTDFWTQVAAVEAHGPGVAVDAHDRGTFAAHLVLAAQYRDDRGALDGPGWFAGFAADGGGVDFFLDQIFADPAEIAAATGSGLRLVPTSGVDDLVTELTGTTAERRRVSTVAADPRVVDAIRDAGAVIDATVLRDADYEAVIARLLDDPGFRS